MKKIILLFIFLLSFFLNKTFAQGCSDYFEIQFTSISNHHICDIDEFSVNIEGSGTVYNSTVDPNSVQAYVNIYYPSVSCGIHTVHEYVTINLTNKTPGTWHYTEEVVMVDIATVRFRYRYRPTDPDNNIILNEGNGSTIFNENDIVNHLYATGSDVTSYRWIFSDVETIDDDEHIYNYALTDLNIDYLKMFTISAYARANSYNSCDPSTITLEVYPRRPIITDIDTDPPSCYNGNDGKIYINEVDGALGGGIVTKYQIGFQKDGITYDLIEESRFITSLPCTLTRSDFIDNALPAYDYIIQIENVYGDGQPNNGFNNYNFTIDEKPILEIFDQDHDNALCNGDANGKLSFKLRGGNPDYDIITLYKDGSFFQVLNNQEEEVLIEFNGLSESNYTVEVDDGYQCALSGTNTFIIDQPDSLKITNLQKTHVACRGSNSGAITFEVTGGTEFSGGGSIETKDHTDPYYNYELYDAIFDGNLFEEGKIYNGTKTIYDLPANDKYSLLIKDYNDCEARITGWYFQITEPETSVQIDSINIKDYNGIQISCNGAKDGQITVYSQGGTGKHNYDYYYKIGQIIGFGSSDTCVIDNLGPGTYSITATDSNSCSVDIGGIQIDEPDKLEFTNIDVSDYNGVNISCKYGENGWIDIDAVGGCGPLKYGINGNMIIPQPWFHRFENLSAGDQNITVADRNNCSADTTINLTQPASLPAIAAVDTSSYNGYGVHCHGDSDGRIRIKVDDTTGTTTPSNTYKYYLNFGDTTLSDSSDTFNNLVPEIYYISVSDANGCFPLVDSVKQITEPYLLEAFASSDTIGNSPFNISCNGFDNGEVTLSASGGVSDYIYNFENEVSTGSETSLKAGTYVYYVTDQNECISEFNKITLTEPLPIIFNYYTNSYIGNHAIRCHGLPDSVLIEPNGGFGADYTDGYYTVELNSVQETINAPDTAEYFDIYADINYDIEITDGNGCTIDSFGVFFSQPDPMQNVYLDTDSTLCHNTTDGKLNIRWTGGSNNYDYFLKKDGLFIDTLINNDTNNIATFENLTVGTYSVIAEDENACIESSTTIRVESPPVLEAGTDETVQPQCYGDTLGNFTVEGTGGTHTNNIYDFYIKTSYGDSIFIADTDKAVFEEVATGTHDYFIIDDNNCLSDPDSFDITEPNEMIVSFETGNVSSQGGSDGFAEADVEGGTNTYDYIWRNSDDEEIGTLQSINNVPAGDYSVEVWDGNQCPYGNSSTGLMQYVTIYEPGQGLELYIVQQHNVSYPGGNDGSVSLDALGGWGQNLYKIQGGIYTPANIFTGLSQGTYWFYVTDGFSTDSLSTTIIEADVLQIQNNTQDVSCYNGADGSVNILATGGTAPYTYSLDDITYVENNTFDELSEGTYTAYVKDYYNISISDNFIISQPEELIADIIVNQHTACGVADGSATAEATGGTTPYLFYWEHSGEYGATAENLEAGTYNVIVTDNNLCTTTDSVIINNSDGPEITSIDIEDALCYNSADGSVTVNITSGTMPFTFEWSNGHNGNENYLTELPPGDYTVQVTDALGCMAASEFTVGSPDPLSFNFSINNPTCYNGCNGSITANLSGGTTPYILYWQNINGNPNTNHVSNLCAGEYVLNVSDANACEYSENAIVENPEQIQILEEDGVTLCQGQSITLDAGNPGSTYQWTSDNGFQSTERLVTLDEAGTYQITVITDLGCPVEDEFTLNFSDSYLLANFLMQSEAEIGDTVVLVEISWEEPDSVSWNFPTELWLLSQSEENVQLIPTQNGVHTVGLTAYLGSCYDFIEKQITITGNGNKDFNMPEYAEDKDKQFKYINLYPNPNSGNFNLDIKLYKKDDIRIEVYDILGQKQQAHKIGKGEKNYTFNFNLNTLKNGLYFISIRTDKGSAGIKFMKK